MKIERELTQAAFIAHVKRTMELVERLDEQIKLLEQRAEQRENAAKLEASDKEPHVQIAEQQAEFQKAFEADPANGIWGEPK